MRIAVLMTCYNRRETTLRCLDSLYNQHLPEEVALKVFLVDDGCTDGTGAAVKAAHPNIEVIQGTGDLFWCNGMRMAWDHAAKEDPDFYLWLNDDVQLREGAIEKLLSCWLSVAGKGSDSHEKYEDSQKILITNNGSPITSQSRPAVIVGSTCDPVTGARTYGGQRMLGAHPAKLASVSPQDVPVECDTFNGNVVLVSRAVYKKIGNMRPFRHAIGDTDYGLRAKAASCRIVVAPGFIGLCALNKEGGLNNSFHQRWTVLMRRFPPGDYFRFLRKHAGWRWPFYWGWPYVNLILSGIRAGRFGPRDAE